MNTRHFRQFFAWASLLAVVSHALAFVVDGGPYWPDGTVTLRLKLGGTPAYSDATNPNSTAAEAAKAWNPYMGRVQLTTTTASTGGGGDHNGTSEVFFSKNIYGTAFGRDVLAVTLIHTSSTKRTECDVVVNQADSWDSYRGYLHSDVYDLRRVLIHEFGHVLGLDHPDENGQYQSAIMNAYIGDIDAPVKDDEDGVASIYGYGTANQPVPPHISTWTPQDQTVVEGQGFSFYVQLDYADTPPFTYQWRKDGVAIPGATGPSYEVAAAKKTHAGLYSVVVTNGGGSATSRAAKLTVNAASLPTVTISGSSSAYLGGNYSFYPWISGGTYPFTIAWEKDGKRLASTDQYLYLTDLKASDAGAYVVIVTNAAGTVRSSAFHLTILPVPAPAELSLYFNSGGSYQIDSSGDLSYEFGPYTYQWFRNGQPVERATSAYYTIPDEWRGEAADYVLVATNSTGGTASRAFIYTPPLSSSSPELGGWISLQRSGDIVYFLYANPSRIERYDLATSKWLPTITLSRKPTAFLPDSSGLYVAFGTSVSHFEIGGTAEKSFATITTEITDILMGNGRLYLVSNVGYYDTQLTSVRLSDHTVLDTETSSYSVNKRGSLSIAPKAGFIFGRDSGLSPADIHQLTLASDGTLGDWIDSPYHGDYPDAQRTFVSPDESIVAEDSGTVYHVADLTYAGALGGAFDDLAFTSSGSLIVLRGSALMSYDSKLVETGRVTLAGSASRMAVRGTTVYLFKPPAGSGTVTTVTKVSLSKLVARQPWSTVSPVGLAYTPSEVILGSDQIVYLLDRARGNVHRWSVKEKRYLGSIPLTGAAQFLTCSSGSSALFASYGDKRISKITLGATISEAPFVSMPSQILGLSTAGDYLFVNDYTGPWSSYYTFTSAGKMVDQVAWMDPSRMYVWNEPNRRLYHFRDNTSPNDLLSIVVNTDGTFGTAMDSPYHDDSIARYPICVQPNGANVLLGSGVFYDGDTLSKNNALPVPIDGAAWLGTKLYTARIGLTGTTVERWGGANYGRDASATMAGRLLRLWPLPGSQLLVVTMRDDAPVFTVLNSALKKISEAPVNAPPTISKIADLWLATGTPSKSISFKIADAETGASSLTVTAASSNTNVVPLDGIALTGTSGNRSIAITPKPSVRGTAKITLSVSDGMHITTTAFSVHVQAPPTIGSIADQTTSEDKPTGAIAVTIADGDTAASALTLTGQASNPVLLPGANLVFGGSAGHRTVILKPATNKNGTTTVTVTVSDGHLTGKRSFKLTVKPINDRPTISTIAAQTVTKNTKTDALAFTISDVEKAAASLSVTATSSNLTLVPASGLVLGGSGANRTIVVTPAKNRTGTAKITLTVSDGVLTATSTFNLTVNAAPTITKIANQTIAKNGSTPALAFKVADAETPVSQLVVTGTSSNPKFVPAENIVLSGSGADRTVKVTFARNLLGACKVTLTVSDGRATSSVTFWVSAKAAVPSGAAPVETR